MKTKNHNKSIRKNKRVKRSNKTIKKLGKLGKLGRLGRGQEQCCMCNKNFNSKDALIPAKCLARKGSVNAHKICPKCWWGKFAIEGVNHQFPGCKKEPIKKRTTSSSNRVIDLVSTSD